MNIFGDLYSRGKYMRVQVDSSGGRGAFLTLGGRSSFPLSNTSPFVVTGFSIQKSEIVAVTQCFNDAAYIYAFGDNIAQSQLGVRILTLNPAAENSGKATSDLLRAYMKHRVGKTDAVSTLTYGGSNVLRGHVLGMTAETASGEFQMQSFNVSLLLTGQS